VADERLAAVGNDGAVVRAAVDPRVDVRTAQLLEGRAGQGTGGHQRTGGAVADAAAVRFLVEDKVRADDVPPLDRLPVARGTIGTADRKSAIPETWMVEGNRPSCRGSPPKSTVGSPVAGWL
jgi:hypothetical protein